LSLQTIARRYASALADIAVERKEEARVQQEIEMWASIIEGFPQLREVFGNPTIPYDQKQRVLEDLISQTRISETSASFLRVLLKNQRLGQLKQVSERLALILDERAGVIGANVITARPIPEEIITKLDETLTATVGRRVRLSFTTDEAIIGGVVTQIGSTIYDGSVQGQLERLAQDLVNR
jgi:F-type H+-transporting ATPase subunit delta